MSEGFDERTGRLYHVEEVLGGGLNMAISPSALQEGVSPNLLGVRCQTGQLVPTKSAMSEVQVTVDEDVRLCVPYNVGTTRYLILLGATKAWYLDSSGATEITPTGGFTDDTKFTRWDGFSMVHNAYPVTVVNNEGLDTPHYWYPSISGGLFLPVCTSPIYQAKTCVPFLNRLVVGFVYEPPAATWYANRLRWSDEGDVTAWNGVTSGYLDLSDEGDPIRALGRTPSNVLYVFRQNSVARAYPTGDPYDPIVAGGAVSSRGIHAKNSLQRIDERFFYLSDDDVYSIAESGFQSIGWPIRKELFRLADSDNLPWSWSFIDRRMKEYYLITPMKDATIHAWIYNYEENIWARQDFSDYTSLGDWYETT